MQAPIIVFDLPSLSMVPQRNFEVYVGTSPSNPTEVAAVETALKRLRPNTSDDDPPSLVVLSPYTAQCELLNARLAASIDQKSGRLEGFASAKDDGSFVHTVDGFQGGEADLVIVSMVRNNQKMGRHALGILADRRRMNVLLSRARHKLVIVTSTVFLKNAIHQWSRPTSSVGLDFMETILKRIDEMADPGLNVTKPKVSIVSCNTSGQVVR